MEAIDKVVTDGMRNAENKCRKIRAGAVPFSPKLAEAGTVIKLWSLVIRHHLGKNINTRYIRRIAKKCNITRALSCTLATAWMNKLKAEGTYYKLKKSAHRLRREFLHQLLTTKESSKTRKAIRRIMKHEETRRAWRTINKGRGKKQLSGVSAVQIRQEDNWVTLTTQQEVEDAIIAYLPSRFNLASTTPLMQPNAVQGIGYLGNTSIADSIIEGTFAPSPELDPYVQKFLQFIGKRPTLPTIPNTVTSGDFQSYWRRSRDRTSSSMSGRNFGHYNAASNS